MPKELPTVLRQNIAVSDPSGIMGILKELKWPRQYGELKNQINKHTHMVDHGSNFMNKSECTLVGVLPGTVVVPYLCFSFTIDSSPYQRFGLQRQGDAERDEISFCHNLSPENRSPMDTSRSLAAR